MQKGDRFMNKLFGIGLMRTGTFSLASALSELGLRVAHFDELRQSSTDYGGWVTGDLDTNWIVDFDAVFDNPVPGLFPQLDKRYPDSKFILTLRDEESWLQSCGLYLSNIPATYEYRKLVRTAVYGMYSFNEERWRYVYRRQIEFVKEYFKNREKDLLIFDLFHGDGWEELCQFLNLKVPSYPFPNLNTSLKYEFKPYDIQKHSQETATKPLTV